MVVRLFGFELSLHRAPPPLEEQAERDAQTWLFEGEVTDSTDLWSRLDEKYWPRLSSAEIERVVNHHFPSDLGDIGPW